MKTLKDTLKAVLGGKELEALEMERAMDLIMLGQADPVQAGGLLCALAARGEAVAEVTGAARSMRRAALPFPSERAKDGIDTCGTGGDGAGTFNISTAAGFVLAAAGVPVAKHGNRAVSSKAGSADLLMAMGARLDLTPVQMARVMDATGYAFLFAPVYHPAMRFAMPIRRALGVRTIFNLLGPISNPAGVKKQVIGVFDRRWLALADVLLGLGTERAMVVHGADGLDELTLTGETYVAEVKDGAVHRYTLSPKDVGLEPAPLHALKGGDAQENVEILHRIFGDEHTSPIGRAVAYNAGAGLYVTGRADTVADGVRLAADTMASGKPLELIARFVAASKEEAERG